LCPVEVRERLKEVKMHGVINGIVGILQAVVKAAGVITKMAQAGIDALNEMLDGLKAS
jgi:hypothetical protein